MPRSSKHKSSKHSSRDARDYSDSEDDSSLKERKYKDDSVTKVSNDSSYGDKRKLENKDAKDLYVAGNGEHTKNHGSAKRRKERTSDGVGDRWNGGEEERPEGSKNSRASGDARSRRRNESLGAGSEGDEVRKSSGRSEGKHRNLSKEGGTDKERKFKEGKSERLIENKKQRPSKQVVVTIDLSDPTSLQSAEPDGQLDKKMKKRSNGYGEGGKCAKEGIEKENQISSKDERQQEKRKDEKYRDKHKEELDRDSKHRRGKQRDEQTSKDPISNRSDEKHEGEGEEVAVSGHKKIRSQGDRDHGHSRVHDGDRSYDQESSLESSRDRDRERHCEHVHFKDQYNVCDHICDCDHDYDGDHNWDWEHGRENDQNRDHDRNCDREHYCDSELDREHERNRHHDCCGSHTDNRTSRYKDGSGKKRSLDGQDDYTDSKSRFVRTHFSDAEKRALSSGRAPVADSHFGEDEYRDLMIEQKMNGSRDFAGFSGLPERVSKYKSMDRSLKTDESLVDKPAERISMSKASPISLVERSPSSTSIDHRCTNKGRQSLDLGDSGCRNSIDRRHLIPEDRGNWDILPEKPPLDDPAQDSSFHGRIGQGNTSGTPKILKAGVDRPFVGSLDDDVSDKANAHYGRTADPGFGRGPGNAWRGIPNWGSPIPSNFAHFQHGPAHGGFPAMMPQFPPQPMFSVRPPMELNHNSIPYHIPEADRFAGHLRPFAWQNFMDGTDPSHLHGWDGNGSIFRDDSHMYNNAEWFQSRQSANSQGWESDSESWKEHDVKKDIYSTSSKDEYGLKHPMDGLSRQGSQMPNYEMEKQDSLVDKVVDMKSSRFTSVNETSISVPAAPCAKAPDSSALSKCDTCHFSHFYLSKLDISPELSNPEVYDQCMALLSPKTVAHEDDTGDGAKVSVNSLKPPSFPLVNNSLFQRAMDLYNRQRAESCTSINGTACNKVSVFDNQGRVREQDLNCRLEDKLESFKVYIATAPFNDDNTGSIAGEECRLDSMLVSSQDSEGCVCSSPLKTVVLPVETSGHEELGDRMLLAKENNSKERPLEKQVNTEGGKGSSAKNNCKEEGPGIASNEAVNASGPLVFQDGCSPKACESNESESLILSRIHRSPESTR